MAKVTFEFDETEDLFDINLVVNRKKMISALDDLNNYIGELNNGFAKGIVIVSGDKVLGDVSCNIPEEYVEKEKKFYVEDEEVIKELEYLIEPIRNLLNDYYY